VCLKGGGGEKKQGGDSAPRGGGIKGKESIWSRFQGVIRGWHYRKEKWILGIRRMIRDRNGKRPFGGGRKKNRKSDSMGISEKKILALKTRPENKRGKNVVGRRKGTKKGRTLEQSGGQNHGESTETGTK